MPVSQRKVASLSKAGEAKLKGDVTLTGGDNVTLTQSGQDISIAAGGGGTVARITNNLSSTTSTTLGNTTGLSFSVTSGNYYKFEFMVLYRAQATTTGMKVALQTPAVTQLSALVEWPTSLISTTGINRITAPGGSVTGSGTPTNSATYFTKILGVIIPSEDGTVQVQHASEVASSAVTVQAGSNGMLWTL